MKAAVFIITFPVFLLLSGDALTQFTGTGKIDSCFNLQNSIFTPAQIVIDYNISYAGNHGISDFYSSEDGITGGGMHCNDSTGCDYSSSALIYDVYYPSAAAYTQYNNAPLPAIFLFHAGGFSDCSSKDIDNIGKHCEGFAERGFIAFNIEYRRGIVKNKNDVSPEKILATYRAIQDAKGAIKSIIKRQLNDETVFKIDTSELFIGGTSAGAIIALGTAFYSQQELDEVIPGVSNPAVLGPLDTDDYYGSVNTAFSFKGVLSMWGGLTENGSGDSSFVSLIKPTDNIAVIAFHGEADSTIPFHTKLINYINTTVAEADQCGFTYKIPVGPISLIQYGSESIYNTLRSFNTPTELYTDSDAPHGLGSKTNYGLPASNVDSVINYITRRSAIFFQAVINKNADRIVRTKFRDCQNLRTGCSFTDASCSSLSVNTVITQPGCYGSNDGAITLSVTGGSSSIFFRWTGPGGFTSSNANISSLSAGTYRVDATDSITGAIGYSVVVLNEPAALNASAQINPVSCFGGSNGSINISASGGTQPYQLSINDGGYSTKKSFKNLISGIYKVDIRDDHGCNKNLDGITVTQPATALDLTLIKKKNVSCINGNDGLLKVNATGGTAPYSFSLNGAAYKLNPTFKQLTAGTYTLIAKDNNNCTDSLISTVANGIVNCLEPVSENSQNNAAVGGNASLNNQGLKIYLSPNPAVEVFTVITESNTVDRVDIIVSDIFGKKVFQANGKPNNSFVFGRQFLPGIYILQVVQGKNVQTLKLIKGGHGF